MTVTVDASEVWQAAAKFRTSSAETSRRVSVAVRKSGSDVATLAKIGAPVDTGRLRNSIHMSMTGGGDSLTAEIAATVHYAVYQEHGTSRMRARPFMRPAFERVLPAFEAAMRQIGGEML